MSITGVWSQEWATPGNSITAVLEWAHDSAATRRPFYRRINHARSVKESSDVCLRVGILFGIDAFDKQELKHEGVETKEGIPPLTEFSCYCPITLSVQS